MSGLSPEAAFKQAVANAVSAAFGGEVPELVGQLVDVDACASLMASGGSKLGFVFRADGEERPRVRVALQNEEARLTELLVGRWPAAAAFIEKYGEGHILAETDGGSDLRLFVTGVDLGSDESGAPLVGSTLMLPEGTQSWLTGYQNAPEAQLNDAQKVYAKSLVDAGAEGMWIIQATDGATSSLTLFTEQPTPDDTLAVTRKQSDGALFRATLDALQAGGRVVDPFMLEINNDGSLDVTLWGIQAVLRRADDLPDFFEPGSTPPADAFANHVAMTVPDAQRDEAAAVVRDTLVPALDATVPEGGDAYAHYADAWRWLIGRLAKEVPFYRLDVLKVVATMASIKALEVPAFHLALARYVASHPGADASDVLPADVAALTVDDLQARARSLAEQLTSLRAAIADVEGLGSKHLPSLAVDADKIEDTVGRAVSGDFTAAVGLLHDYFMELGPGGYDDDPTLASLDDIDLEADAAEAAIEEALAMDDDDDF